MDHAVLLCWIGAESYDAVESALDAEAEIATWSLSKPPRVDACTGFAWPGPSRF